MRKLGVSARTFAWAALPVVAGAWLGCTSILGDFSTGAVGGDDGGPSDGTVADQYVAPEAAPDGPDCRITGTCPPGTTCTNGAQCSTGVCKPDNACAAPDCAADAGCALGTACLNAGGCASGHCIDGVCCAAASCPACTNCGSTGQCDVPVATGDDKSPKTCQGDTTCVGGACTPRWTVVSTKTVADAFEPRFVTSLNSTMYVADTGNYFLSYSFATSAWTSLTPSTDFCNCGFEGILVGTTSGPMQAANGAEFWNGSSWASVTYPQPAIQRGEAVSAVLGSVYFHIGGRDINNIETKSVFSYDVSTGASGSWNTSWTSAPGAVYQACAGADATSGKIYVFSGLPGSTVYAFDSKANSWGALPASANYAGHCYIKNAPEWKGKLVVVETSELQLFDTNSLTWSYGSPTLTLPSSSDPGTFAPVAPADGNLYVVGYASASKTITLYKWNLG